MVERTRISVWATAAVMLGFAAAAAAGCSAGNPVPGESVGDSGGSGGNGGGNGKGGSSSGNAGVAGTIPTAGTAGTVGGPLSSAGSSCSGGFDSAGRLCTTGPCAPRAAA